MTEDISIVSRLAECERIIEVGLDQFLAVGTALTDIRDARLYRASHKTFSAYCRERWGMGKSHAYRLIDHAKTLEAINEAAGGLSPVGDISEAQTREIKADLPAVIEDIKARVAGGQEPDEAAADAIKSKREEKAAAKETTRAEETRRQADRDAMVAQLPADVRERLSAADAAKAQHMAEAGETVGLPPEDRIAELEAKVESLEAELATATGRIAELSRFEAIEADYKAGGFDAVVAAERATVETWKAKYHTENREKVAAQRSTEFWRKRAIELGHSSDAEATGDVEVVTRGRAARAVPGAFT